MKTQPGGPPKKRHPSLRRMAVAGVLLLGVLGGGAYALLVAVPPHGPAFAKKAPEDTQDARATLKDGQDAHVALAVPFAPDPQATPLHSSPFTLHSSPSLPIPWNAVLRNSLPDGMFLPEEPEGPLLDLTDPEQLASVLRNRGETIAGLYETLSADQRAELILTLNSTGLLQSHAGGFLEWEPGTHVRALLLECIDPMDFDSTASGSPNVELLTLLDLPTATPIGAQEWIARMELASRLSPEIGAEWVRAGRQAFPNSTDVEYAASIITLVDGMAAEDYGAGDRVEAAAALARLLGGREAGGWSAESRMRAYYAMSFSPDPGPVIAFYRARAGLETDPRAREVLGALHARLLVQSTTLP